MKADNYFTGNSDLMYSFEHLPWNQIVPLVEDGFRDGSGPRNAQEATELYRDALTLVGEYAGHDIAARARDVDASGSSWGDHQIGIPEPLRRNLDGLRDLGVTGLSAPRQYGGENFPFTVSSMALEMIARACPSTMVQFAFFISPATMVQRFGREEQRRCLIPRLAVGEISGAVAMTEPEAGSDVGAISTQARLVQGEWRISGRKQFITNGGADFCIVLARSEENSVGLDGLSLFLVARLVGDADNYVVERQEEKISITASATCSLAFNTSKGELLGKRGQGWREILTFMNESRVAVGIQGIGTAQASFVEARDYARSRCQMGKPIREHPLVAEMLLDMEATLAGLRALAYESTSLYDISAGLEREAGKLPEGEPRRAVLEKQARQTAAYLRELTPLVKWMGAEETVRICRLAMQIHGGYGIIKDYDVERLLRDSLILPIYEGTSQIQALMATKDILKQAMARRTVLAAGTISPSLAGARFDGEMGRLYRDARSNVSSAVRFLIRDLLFSDGLTGFGPLVTGKREFSDERLDYVLLHAERLTAMLAHLHAARLLGLQAMRSPERLRLAKRSMRKAAAIAQQGASIIKSGDRSTLHEISSWQNE
ncbi:MAG: acyl-CoA dehydrogenase family protein [Chloroflexota bacterium]